MAIKYDNCKDCHSRCIHAGKDREFICINGVSCKITKQKPNTNADRIQAMSDEELAENLYLFCDLEERIGYCKNTPECEKLLETEAGIPEKKCIGCLLDWLKQPAEKDGI